MHGDFIYFFFPFLIWPVLCPFCASSCFMVLLFPSVSLHPCFSSWSGPWCVFGEMLRSLNLMLGNLQDKLLSSRKGSPFSSRVWVYRAEPLCWEDLKLPLFVSLWSQQVPAQPQLQPRLSGGSRGALQTQQSPVALPSLQRQHLLAFCPNESKFFVQTFEARRCLLLPPPAGVNIIIPFAPVRN